MCRKKQRMFNRAKNHHRKKYWQNYKSFKRDVTRTMRKARWEYINGILQLGLEEGNSRPFWRYIKSQKQDNVGIPALSHKLVTNNTQKAEILNDQFKSVFTKDDPDSECSKNRPVGPSYPPIAHLSISTKGVEKLLTGLNPSKASGPDLIPCRILKELAVELAPGLSSIYDQSLKQGVLPKCWTQALVTPVFKKGSKRLAENYRPVSLTCITCKILEHILCSHIRDHLDRYDILTPLNHGFRSKHSCESQLLLTMHDLMYYRDRKVQIDVAILDFAKAFDTVPHNRLLNKLEFYGVQGDFARWISLFLKSRDQCVVVDGGRSSTTSVDSGMPQGTVLGPLLFLLHINDLPSIAGSQVRLFADDCLMYRPVHSRADQELFQKDLAALEGWGDAWGMRFNAAKCNIMRISRSTKPLIRFYSLCNCVLQEVDQAKYLGVNITRELQWSGHITSTTGKANSSLAFLGRNLKDCPQKLKEMAYISLVRSVLEYSSSIWDPCHAKDISSIERIQRRAARFVKSDYRTTSSVTAMINDLGWKDLAHRRRDLRLALLHKVVYDHIAVSADSLGLLPGDKRLRSSHKKNFKHLPTNTDPFRYSFVPRTIIEWNSLPASAVECTSPESFKTQLARVKWD